MIPLILNAIAQPPRIDFARDIRPILKAHCYLCHGPERHEGNLRLDLKKHAFVGLSGRPIVAGDSERSLIVQRITGAGGKPRMPLGLAPVPAGQIRTIRAWIDQGAVWPDSADSNARHWAYIPPIRRAPPQVRLSSWVLNPIDNFILARLEKEGLKPSPPAPREKLIRRVYLDLIGLPPTPKEVDDFLADRAPGAYERVVDRLLANPHFGERWARPWLDLARYADTNGYEKDGSRSIWPYRDWVINAFNQDMPYDRFTIEQIAGDLLPNATRDQKIATGFHRNTMLNEEGGVDRDEQRWLTNVDRVGTTGSVWLGTTTACTQCHDHKYDPFTQKEFYRLFAFWEHSSEPTLELSTEDQESKRRALQAEISAVESTLKAERSDSSDKSDKTILQTKLAELKKQLGSIRPATTLVMEDKNPGETPTTYTRIKGAFLSKGEQVTAGTPVVLTALPRDKPLNRLGLAYWLVDPDNALAARVAVNRFWEQIFGRGIVETAEDFGTQGTPPSHPELLDWLAWEFMKPISSESKVLSSEAQNSELRTQNWSVKHLLRLIVTSAAYRQSSRVTPELLERDPNNRLLARGPRFRMEAEMIRDSSLAAAGLLSPRIGGPSVFPVQPDGIWDVPYSGEKWETSKGEDRYRRGLYTFWRRSAPYPEFISFDATSREFCTIRRSRTNTPLQALTTLNDPAFFEAARGLARRIMTEGGPYLDSRLRYGIRLCLSRNPSANELAGLKSLYGRQMERFVKDEKAAQAIVAGPRQPGRTLAETAALTIVSNVLLNLDETLTKE